jgi:hypothetical protein
LGCNKLNRDAEATYNMPENEEAENCNLEELDRSQEENMKSKVSLSEKLKKMSNEALAQHINTVAASARERENVKEKNVLFITIMMIWS